MMMRLRLSSLCRIFFILVIAICLLCASSSSHAKKIDDCCCEAETIDVGNADELYSQLQDLRKSVFFRTFKVNLHTPCPYWQDENEQCARRGCAVCGECKPDEIPTPWRIETTDPVDKTLSKNFRGWDDADDHLWIVQDSAKDISYINMNLNPEGYTGYEGVAPRRIWSAIFDENCFHGSFTDMCFEQRVFYRLMSGLRASISAHIASNYPVGDSVNDIYSDTSVMGPNYEVYEEKLGAHQDRLNNLYFAYVFMLRAVNKAAPLLRSYDYRTGNDIEDQLVLAQIDRILSSKLIQQCLPHTSFDESTMFNSPNSHHLKREFKSHFRNISRIMDCVGCEKCKLHGKLQILGIGTALKILFTEGNVHLQRNEVMALLVTLAKFSNAIKVTHDMRWLKYQSKALLYFILIVGAVMLVIVCSLCLRVCQILRRRSRALTARAAAKKTS